MSDSGSSVETVEAEDSRSAAVTHVISAFQIFVLTAIATWASLLSSNHEFDTFALWLAPGVVAAAFLVHGVVRAFLPVLLGLLVGMFPFDPPGLSSPFFPDPTIAPFKFSLVASALVAGTLLLVLTRRYTKFPESPGTFAEITRYILVVHLVAAVITGGLIVLAHCVFVDSDAELSGMFGQLFSWSASVMAGGLVFQATAQGIFRWLAGHGAPDSFFYSLAGGTVAVALILGFVSENWNLDREALVQRAEGDIMAITSSLVDDVERSRLSLEHMASVVARDGSINRQDFDYFAEQELARNPVLVSLNYAPVIFADEKASMEARIRGEYGEGVLSEPDGMFILDKDRKRQPVAQKPTYVPILFQFPWQENFSLVGFDFDYKDIRKRIMETMSRTRSFAMSGATRIMRSGDAGVRGLIFTMPVIRDERIIGYIVSGIQSHNFMDNALSQLRGQYWLNIHDLDGDRYSLIFWSGPEKPAVKPAATMERLISGRQWQVTIYPTPDYLAASNRSMAFLTVSVSVILAILYCYLVLMAVGNRRSAERLVAERTAELERANRAKSDFLANVSHEIRTPMNGILGMLKLLGEVTDENERQEYIALARMSGEGLIHVINDILDLSRLEDGQLEIENRPGDLEKTLKGIVSMMQPAAAQKGLSMFTRVDDDLPLLEFDAHRIGQILINLISNSIKFTEEGRISVFCDVLPGQVPGRRHIRISVEDTGIGIPAEDQPEIFNRFRQADNSSARKHQGTGLGLAITQELLLLMGGTVRLESREGEGTTFIMDFDLKEASDRRGNVREATEDTRAGELTGRVLVAEDNKVNQMLVRKMLEKQGLVVEMAGNGVEAVDYINDVASGEKLPVDLILMDVQMPEMDGIEATRLIREREDDLSGIPILAVTANAMSEQAEEYHQAGMDGFVSKPIDFMLLKAEIRKILEAGDQD